MFYCYFVINAYFMGDFETGEKYAKHLDVRVTLSIFSLVKIIHNTHSFFAETLGTYLARHQARSRALFGASSIN